MKGVLSRRVPGFNLELRKLTGCVEIGLFRNKSGKTSGGYGSSVGKEHSDSVSGEDRLGYILDIEPTELLMNWIWEMRDRGINYDSQVSGLSNWQMLINGGKPVLNMLNLKYLQDIQVEMS